MEQSQWPPPWDDIGFAEFRDVIEEACGTSRAAGVLRCLEQAEAAWSSPRSRRFSSRAVDRSELQLVTHDLRRLAGETAAELSEFVKRLDGAHLLCAISALGALDIPLNDDPIMVPGAYDREIEWLAKLPLHTTARVPDWDEVFKVLYAARKCLLAELAAPSPDYDVRTKFREASVFTDGFGMTYGPIAAEITKRLAQLATTENSPLSSGPFETFPSVMDAVFAEHVGRILYIARSGASLASYGSSHESLRDMVVRRWSVGELGQALCLGRATASHECIKDLTTTLDDSYDERVDLRARPLLALNESAVLVLPRRILCDRHDLFDNAASRYLRQCRHSLGIYPDLRAKMLDNLIADSLRRILPGCQVFVGKTWEVNGRRAEHDVVVFFEDVAICVEGKASPLRPSRRAGRRDLIGLLREVIAPGVQQVTTIADALERGIATLDNTLAPKVRRAYRFVASFTPWWGVELRTAALRDQRVLPELDSAMLTAADKFLCFESLFQSPGDFLGYLDLRLSYQKRTWLTVADEYELIGAYFSTFHDDLGRVGEMALLLKDAFQEDVTRTVQARYLGTGQGSEWLEPKHHPFVKQNLTRWERSRPPGWLQAFSAASRLPIATQYEIARETQLIELSANRKAQVFETSDKACAVMVLEVSEEPDRRRWNNLLRNVRPGDPIIAILRSTSGLRIIAVRGRDDDECWMDPEFRDCLVVMDSPVTWGATTCGGDSSVERKSRAGPLRRCKH